MAENNKVVMDVQDAIDLYRYIKELEVENRVLKEQIEKERLAVQEYVDKTNELIMWHESERQSWEKLAAEINAELNAAERKKYKYALLGFVLGGVVGAVVD